MHRLNRHVAPFIIDVQPDPKPDQAHCPYCARALAQDYAFCPGCGHDTRDVYRCEQCGHIQVIPAEANIKYCVQCGTQITEGSGRYYELKKKGVSSTLQPPIKPKGGSDGNAQGN